MKKLRDAITVTPHPVIVSERRKPEPNDPNGEASLTAEG